MQIEGAGLQADSEPPRMAVLCRANLDAIFPHFTFAFFFGVYFPSAQSRTIGIAPNDVLVVHVYFSNLYKIKRGWLLSLLRFSCVGSGWWRDGGGLSIFLFFRWRRGWANGVSFFFFVVRLSSAFAIVVDFAMGHLAHVCGPGRDLISSDEEARGIVCTLPDVCVRERAREHMENWRCGRRAREQ